jgi:hypothetical protein
LVAPFPGNDGGWIGKFSGRASLPRSGIHSRHNHSLYSFWNLSSPGLPVESSTILRPPPFFQRPWHRRTAHLLPLFDVYLIPQQYDCWDGSDGSSDTDFSDSAGELVAEPTSSGLAEANTAYLDGNTLKESVSAAHFAPDFSEQRAAGLGKRALQVDNAHQSNKETLSALTNTNQEEKGDMPIKAAVRTDSPASEGERWIPEGSIDVGCYESYREGINNPAAGSEPTVRNQTSTSEEPTRLMSQRLLQESNIVLNTGHLFEDIENHVGSFSPQSRPTSVADQSPEIAYRTDYEDDYVTEFDQYDANIHTNSEFALEGVPEDTLSHHHEGLDMSPGQA